MEHAAVRSYVLELTGADLHHHVNRDDAQEDRSRDDVCCWLELRRSQCTDFHSLKNDR